MHILILPMYYPEKDSSPHRGYMFFEQAMQLAKSGCKVGLAFTEQRPLKNFTWKRFRKESHFQISAEDNGSFVTMRLHAWNPKLSTRAGGIIWSLLTVLLVRKYIRTYGRPDLIHAHFGTWAGYAARLVYKWYKIPYVITEHASSINGNQTTPSQAVILKKAYSEARKIICVGTKLKRSLCAYVSDPDKVTVIPNFTFGIVFIEAMATGLPAIGTICGGPEDIITPESGFLIRPGNVDALAAKMKTLYDTYESFDKEKIRQSIVSRFDFQLAGQKLRQVYSEALEMSKPPKASES